MNVTEDVVTDAFEELYNSMFYFYVPRRDVWVKWKEFFREDEVDES